MPNPFEAGATATLEGGNPAAPQAPGNAIELLKQIFQQKSIAPQDLTSFGTQPTAARPQPTFQPPQQLLPGYEHSYGSSGERKRSEKEALFYNIGQIVQSYGQLENQKKERHSQMLVERLQSAMQGLQEAQASGDKEAIQHNAQIMNDIMSDPKNRKVLEKAYDINFFGKSKGKDSPEQAGLFKALQQMDQKFKSGQDPLNAYAQRFQQMMPQRAQLSPQYQAMAQAIKDKLIPGADKELEAQTKTFKDILDNQSKYDTNQAKVQIADMMAKLKSQQAQNQYLAYIARTQGMVEAQRMRSATEIRKVQMQTDNQMKMLNQRMDMMKQIADANNEEKTKIQEMKGEQGKDIEKMKLQLQIKNNSIKQLNTEYSQAQKDLAQVQSDINKRMSLISGYSKSEITKLFRSGDIGKLNAEIQQLKEKQSQIQGKISGIDSRRQMMMQMLGIQEPQQQDINVDTGNQDIGNLPEIDTKDFDSIIKSMTDQPAAETANATSNQ